tara:strand:+ start:553 stop:759 length:207 start_codon:yes stop_codon:yes gene_type:complete
LISSQAGIADKSLADLQHQIFLLSFNDKLVLAPIAEDEIKHVLDIGTGSGIWPVEFGKSSLSDELLIR